MGITFTIADAPLRNGGAALRRALDPSQVRAPLARFLGADPNAIRVTVERTHFSASRPVTLHYRVATGDGDAGVPVLAELAGRQAEAHAVAEIARLSKSRRGQIPRGAKPGLQADPETGLVFRHPGLDAKLPGLKLLHDHALAAEMAARAAALPRRGLRVTPSLRAHRLGKRAVLQLDLHGSGSGRLFVRLRATSAASANAAYDRHREIAEALEGVAGIEVPRPLHHDDELGASFFAALPGTPPGFVALQGQVSGSAMAASLAAILQHGPETAAPYTVAEEQSLLHSWVDRLHGLLPDHAALAAQALETADEALQRLDPVAPRPCHRDFHEGQVLIDGRQAGVLDFDTYRLADPGIDAGNMIAHLRLRALGGNWGIALAEKTFRMGMLPHAGPQRMAAWTRAALVRLGCIYAFTSRGPAAAPALFREAMR
ncbi:MAG TPA: aminoglycoside phosphotransferase family protein [Thermohalobaculum sp.]|nr:aminoglycoside phosphotransferase family protein [Thermohalobaculum sp.]